MDTIKIILATLISGFIAYLQPVHNAMIVLTIVFSADIVFGILADIFVNKMRFSPKKSLFAFITVAIYLSIVSSVYIIGERMGDSIESLYVVKTLTYVFIYFYVSNSIRNLKLLFPNNRVFKFLDYLLGLEFLERIPALGSFLEKENNDKKENNEKK